MTISLLDSINSLRSAVLYNDRLNFAKSRHFKSSYSFESIIHCIEDYCYLPNFCKTCYRFFCNKKQMSISFFKVPSLYQNWLSDLEVTWLQKEFCVSFLLPTVLTRNSFLADTCVEDNIQKTCKNVLERAYPKGDFVFPKARKPPVNLWLGAIRS